MEWFVVASQVVIALGLLNVWLLRTGKPTAWRGGSARNMREEFTAYGLPGWAMAVVGGLKVTLALLLIIGLWIPSVAGPAALGTAILMLGAVGMHLKIGDPLKKSLPAFGLLLLCLVVAFA
jgi:hypothetical protein